MRPVAFTAAIACLLVPGPVPGRTPSPPHVPHYDWLAQHLPRYQELSKKKWPGPLPAVKKLSPGESYAGAAALSSILRDLGDLPADAALPADGTYAGALVDAVKSFQRRHGLTADGVLGAATFAALNQPYAHRLEEIEESLKWLATISVPSGDLVVVNIPAFQLYAFRDGDLSAGAALRMNVVVGKAVKFRTPILSGTISYLVFSPYWYVPRSIIVKEMLPAYRKDPAYFEKHELELTTSNDDAAPGVAATPENVEKLRAGAYGVRQRPGPRNSLGKVKFIFPNADSVYLHDTPAKSLFARDRRDFSHGCVRVSDPPALAAYLLRKAPAWDASAIRAAMDAGKAKTVPVKPGVPVALLYTTAVADFEGTLYFFEDVYRRGEPAGALPR